MRRRPAAAVLARPAAASGNTASSTNTPNNADVVGFKRVGADLKNLVASAFKKVEIKQNSQPMFFWCTSNVQDWHNWGSKFICFIPDDGAGQSKTNNKWASICRFVCQRPYTLLNTVVLGVIHRSIDTCTACKCALVPCFYCPNNVVVTTVHGIFDRTVEGVR